MTWTQKKKSIPISNSVGHNAKLPMLIGRAPGVSGFDFEPIELFGAAARCSHLHTVDPSLVTMESTIFSSMIAPHVDDHSDPFFFLPSADNFKDFIKSQFAGAVAQGLAYLAMTRDNYSWVDHFENLAGSAKGGGRAPDFVFGGYDHGVALVESKGTRSASATAFDATVRDGYTGQIEPHLGQMIGGAIANHGYCVGASMHTSVHADIIVHHTAVPAGRDEDGGRPENGLGTVQRGNFATAFTLAHSQVLGEAIGGGDRRIEQIPFVRFQWRGRDWLTSWRVDQLSWGAPYLDPHHGFPYHEERWERRVARHLAGFAIEEDVALRVLDAFLADGPIRPGEETVLDIPTFHGARRDYEGEAADGAIFPDGLAILGRKPNVRRVRPGFWDRATRQLI